MGSKFMIDVRDYPVRHVGLVADDGKPGSFDVAPEAVQEALYKLGDQHGYGVWLDAKVVLAALPEMRSTSPNGFDTFEVTPLVALDEDNCVIPLRLLDSVPAVAHEPALNGDTEIACWRISGSQMPGKMDVVADCRSEEMARFVAHALTLLVAPVSDVRL